MVFAVTFAVALIYSNFANWNAITSVTAIVIKNHDSE